MAAEVRVGGVHNSTPSRRMGDDHHEDNLTTRDEEDWTLSPSRSSPSKSPSSPVKNSSSTGPWGRSGKNYLTWVIPALCILTTFWFIRQETFQLGIVNHPPYDYDPQQQYDQQQQPPQEEEVLLVKFATVMRVSSALSSLDTNSTSTTTEISTKTPATPSSSSFQKAPSKYAYAFVIGGCLPEKPHYRHYIYNILVATKILRQLGSTQDVIAIFQLKAESNYTTLPYEPDVRALQAMQVRIFYIPQQGNETFYRTQMDKFRILGLTSYRRVLFMDGDVMPGANLDYLFEMSEQGIIKENLVMQGVYEPANGGFFMLETGHLEQIQAIIDQREIYARTHPWPFFDFDVGWGHVIQPPDQWVTHRGGKGTNWTFLAAFADQGLLYHYVKYARGSVSIFMRHGYIQNWSRHANGSVFLESTSDGNPFKNFSRTLKCWGSDCFCGPPLSDFHHFTGTSKPWLRGPPDDMLLPPLGDSNLLDSSSNRPTYDPLSSPAHYWYDQLMKINDQLNLSLNFSGWIKSQRPSLGMYPTWSQVPTAFTNILTPLTPAEWYYASSE